MMDSTKLKSSGMTMKRIVGIEKKQRITKTVRIEQELIDQMKKNSLDLSDFINVSLEKSFAEKGIVFE
jgi:hypothetical protein